MRTYFQALLIAVIVLMTTHLPAQASGDSFRTGKKLFSLGNHQAAREAFQAAVDSIPHHPEAWYLLGRCWLEEEDYQQAAACFTRVIVLQPEFPQVFFYRAQASRHLSDLQQALEDLTTALHHDSTHVQAYLHRAEILFNSGNLQQAYDDYSRVVSLGYVNANVFLMRSRLLAAMGEQEKALSDLTHAVEADPRLAEARLERGLLLMQQEAFRPAADDFSAAIAEGIYNQRIYALRAETFFLSGQYLDAVNDYTTLINTFRLRNFEFYFKRALSYFHLKDMDGAIAAFTQVVALDSTNACAFFYRAQAYHAIGKTTLAIKDINQALALNPGLSEARERRALWLVNAGDFQAVVPHQNPSRLPLTHFSCLHFPGKKKAASQNERRLSEK